jgi:hypothetical protein
MERPFNFDAYRAGIHANRVFESMVNLLYDPSIHCSMAAPGPPRSTAAGLRSTEPSRVEIEDLPERIKDKKS